MDIKINRLKNIFSQNNTLSPNDWKGAVLFLFDEKGIYLIRRSESMPTHAGQLAFFGGHKKPHETSPIEVALREFEEETSLGQHVLRIHGLMNPVMTARLQPIVPVLGEMTKSRKFFIENALSNGEWDSLVVYDWQNLIQEQKWQYGFRHGFSKHPVLLHPIDQMNYLSNTTNSMSHLLWGATAQMIWSFLGLYFNNFEKSE